MNEGFQLFKPSGAGSQSSNDFVKAAFQDISVPADSNVGLSSTISTNPLGGYYANDDAPKYGVKTLWIKDLVLIEDRSKWQDSQPTYRVVFNETFPGVDGYVFGAPYLERGQRAVPGSTVYDPMNSQYNVQVGFRNINGGMGVTGKIRRVMWLTVPNNTSTGGTESGLIAVDGISGATVNQNNADNPYYVTQGRVYSGTVHAAANETNDIHDYRFTSNGLSGSQSFGLRITGVVVYFENSGANIECFPGTSYIDKTKQTTAVGATLPLPTFGASLGGRSLVYKDSASSYVVTSVGHTPIVSVATGSSGTNLLTVTTGHGASFHQGQGIIALSGTSHYVGVIQSISTDTFTVGPTLHIGVSGAIYPYYWSSVTAPISASLYSGTPAFSFGATAFQGATTGATLSFWTDPYSRYVLGIAQMYGQYIGVSGGIGTYDGKTWALYPGLNYQVGAGGNLMAQGRCAAADIEWYSGFSFGASAQILQYHLLVDGITTVVHSSVIGQSTSPKYIKHTLLTDGGPMWHQFNIVLGPSHGPQIGVNKINFYDYAPGQGVTFGHLATFDTMQAVASVNPGSSFQTAPGMYQRYSADSLYFNGGAVRVGASTLQNGWASFWNLTGANHRLDFQWYGKDIMIKGLAGGGSLFISIDGVQNSAGVSLFNTVIPVASEGFHKLIVERRAVSVQIGAVDVSRSHGEFESKQNFTAVEPAKVPFITDWTPYACYIADISSGLVMSDPAATVKAKYKVIDDVMFVQAVVTFSGTIVDGSYCLSLPTEYPVDYKRQLVDSVLQDVNGISPSQCVGEASIVDASDATYVCRTIMLGSQYIYPAVAVTSSTYLTATTNRSNGFKQGGTGFSLSFASGDAIILNARLTIVKPGT